MLLLAVVADVHASFRLARHDCPHRRKPGRRNRVRIDAFAAGAPDEKVGRSSLRAAAGCRRASSESAPNCAA